METFLLAVRVLLSLAVVLGLLWVLQRRLTSSTRAGRSATLVNVVARQGITPKASLVIVDAEGQRFLLGVTEQSVSVLHTAQVPADLCAADEFARSMNAAIADSPGPATLTAVPSYGSAPTHPQPPGYPPAGARRSGRRAARPVPSWEPPKTDPRLGGSILSPDTWKNTVAALRQGRNG